MPPSKTYFQEPVPIWPEAPRLSPHKSFPAYRYVPGLNPHPSRDPQGHSHYVPPDRWRENEEYLHGIDLYHQSYFWESHEVWEGLWHLTDKEGPEGQWLQGLIQNSAALLKVHQHLWDAARHLSQKSYRRLTFVMNAGVDSSEGRYMGISVKDLLKDMESYYRPLWIKEDLRVVAVRIEGRPPRLIPA